MDINSELIGKAFGEKACSERTFIALLWIFSGTGSKGGL
jgi:hypothetical protein